MFFVKNKVKLCNDTVMNISCPTVWCQYKWWRDELDKIQLTGPQILKRECNLPEWECDLPLCVLNLSFCSHREDAELLYQLTLPQYVLHIMIEATVEYVVYPIYRPADGKLPADQLWQF